MAAIKRLYLFSPEKIPMRVRREKVPEAKEFHTTFSYFSYHNAKGVQFSRLI